MQCKIALSVNIPSDSMAEFLHFFLSMEVLKQMFTCVVCGSNQAKMDGPTSCVRIQTLKHVKYQRFYTVVLIVDCKYTSC